MKTKVVAIVFMLFVLTPKVYAQALSIYEIQYTTDPNGDSPYAGSVVDCNGGVVIQKFTGSRTRLILYDPDYPDGWGGIQAKDRYGVGAFNDVNTGDWISFTNMEVEDFLGTTFLQYKGENDPNFTIVNSNNPLPKPIPLAVNQIAAPIEGDDEWTVADHTAEKYESMLIKVIDVNILDLDIGQYYDNYVLQSNIDPNNTCWVSDYMNADTTEKYHSYVDIGENFCGIAGILEQYEGWADEFTYFDYYQLLTRDTNDFIITQTADLDNDCDVDFDDFASLANHWLDTGCTSPGYCDGADITEEGDVNNLDLDKLSENWLEGKLKQ